MSCRSSFSFITTSCDSVASGATPNAADARSATGLLGVRGQVGGENVVGVPVETLASTVVPHGRSRVRVAGGGWPHAGPSECPWWCAGWGRCAVRDGPVYGALDGWRLQTRAGRSNGCLPLLEHSCLLVGRRFRGRSGR